MEEIKQSENKNCLRKLDIPLSKIIRREEAQDFNRAEQIDNETEKGQKIWENHSKE